MSWAFPGKHSSRVASKFLETSYKIYKAESRQAIFYCFGAFSFVTDGAPLFPICGTFWSSTWNMSFLEFWFICDLGLAMIPPTWHQDLMLISVCLCWYLDVYAPVFSVRVDKTCDSQSAKRCDTSVTLLGLHHQSEKCSDTKILQVNWRWMR